MALPFKFLCCIILICGFVFPAQGESFEQHVNSFCESVRKPDMQPNAELVAEIVRLAGKQQVHVKSEMTDRYPILAYLVLLHGAWMAQETLDDLEGLSARKRVRLCQVLEMERLNQFVLRMEYGRMESYCESASQPTQTLDTKLLGEIAELALKNKVSLKPDVVTRYPALVYRVLSAQSSEIDGDPQETLGKLEALGMEKRAWLCKILENERLKLKRIDLNYQAEIAMIAILEHK